MATKQSTIIFAQLGAWFVYVAIFTLSWDRLGAFRAWGYNVKIPFIFSALALLFLCLGGSLKRNSRLYRIKALWLIPSMAVWLGIAAIFTKNPFESFVQSIALLGAIPLFISILLVSETREKLIKLVKILMLGGIFSALHGIYQMCATLNGWFQVVPYPDTALGVVRISSFNYESGYFGYFMVMVLGCTIALFVIEKRKYYIFIALFLILVTILANSRAVFLTLPIFVILIAWKPAALWLKSESRKLRIILLISIPTFIGLLFAGISILFPQTLSYFTIRFLSIFDPNEASSNSVRLDLYSELLRIISENIFIGIGPGQLNEYLEHYNGGSVALLYTNQVVANNAYLQAVLDGGFVFFALQIAWIVSIFCFVYLQSNVFSRIISSSWLAVALVSFFVTSFFWDIKLWAIAGLAWAGIALDEKISSSLEKAEK